jgi:hypothetical protein
MEAKSMKGLRSERLVVGFLAILVFSVAGSCKRENRGGAEALTASLMFGDASPDAREALAAPVNFTITDKTFAQWEKAQRNLDNLPRSAISSSAGVGSTAVDRAVNRLESSPYARTAIERTGLSVRDFVLQTIALAQAAEAAQTGKSLSGAPIPRENFQFVQRYTARALYSGSRARNESRSSESDGDAADFNSAQSEMDAQMQTEESERSADAAQELQNQGKEMERQGDVQQQPRLPSEQPRDPPRDSSRNSARDSVRDSLTTQRR